MLVARAFQVRGNAQKPRVHFNGLNSELTKSVVIMARIPGAVVKSVPWPSGALDLTPGDTDQAASRGHSASITRAQV